MFWTPLRKRKVTATQNSGFDNICYLSFMKPFHKADRSALGIQKANEPGLWKESVADLGRKSKSLKY